MARIAHVPIDEETARRAVEPYLDMTPEERLDVFASLLADMDALASRLATDHRSLAGLDPEG